MTRVARLVLTVTALGFAPALAPAPAQQPEYETRQILDNVYMFRYRTHNTIFIVTGDGVIAFDPINPEAARIYRQEIARVTSEPIVTIVYSHHHADHISGAAELGAGAGAGADVPIIAHVAAYARLAAEPNPDIVLPSHTFTDEMSMRIQDVTIRLIYLGRNHSDNMIVAFLPEQRFIFAVDFVSNDRVGYRDLPGYYLPDLWESLERLQHLDYQLAVFGHGPTGTKADVYEQINYWTDVRRAVESAIAAGISEDEAVETIELPAYADWGGYENWFKMNLRTVYRHYAGE